ncbi:uncharacterized protein (TIGR02453 family) [Maribacter spongiicola]|uniref:Uncharacterized protein (TIGR02453 family) n=1 Tax=Maribacter spongiicola TaxID=1206753 RepID=A0A4R7K403_9FLAO|nr:uncharacterized protein (TIGR02453 family) [Maribacter spongiicola]
MVNFSLKSQELGRMLETKITKSTFQFLNKLKKNNNRDWFTEHKAEFKAEETKVKSFFNHILEKLKTHDEIEKLKVFRIYRDVRFSKNKTPYKTNFSASFSRAGKHRRGGYYLQVAPSNSFVAVGFWNPEKEDLLRIRKEWEIDTSDLTDIINDKKFNAIWGPLVGDELKTAPKGFDKEDPNIEYIRKKQYIFVKNFTDKEVLSDDFANKVNDSFAAIRPYFDLMSNILTTNLNGESLLD